MEDKGFESEWEELKKERQKLMDTVAHLRYEAKQLLADPAMQEVFKEKTQLKELAKNLRIKIKAYENIITARLEFLGLRQTVSTSERLQRDFAGRIMHYAVLLGKLEEMHLPESRRQHKDQISWEIEADLSELESVIRKRNAEEEEVKKEMERVLDSTETRIIEITELYRRTQKCLEKAIHNAELTQHQHWLKEMAWATQSRAHLQWTLKHEASYQAELIRRYRARFPVDSLQDILSPVFASEPISSHAIKKKKSYSQQCEKILETIDSPASQPWRFLITLDVKDPGKELSQRRKKFLQILQSILREERFEGLDATLLYNRLRMISNMSIPERQTMDKIAGGELQGWKKLKTGKWRIFLNVDEEKRCIRFLPRSRRKAYSNDMGK